ncbi:MAG TPA: TM0106 family RecB-like putative nuclease [Candidatus Eisenbacteria bacterium]
MKRTDRELLLSATDLANHLACRHLTSLDQWAVEGRLGPPHRQRPDLDLLQERGLRHERAYLDHLSAQGLEITRLDDGRPEDSVERTARAMRSGVAVIAQAGLACGRWLGRADVLRRVDSPSRLGAWSYEVYDTKLSAETRGGTILQLCLYSNLLSELQGVVPEFMHVVPPGRDFVPHSFRLHDFLAYYRWVRERLEAVVDPMADSGASGESRDRATYPDPVPHCDVCRWRPACDRRRRADDHLCLVAGISKSQTRELEEREIGTLEALAKLDLPLPWTPRRGARDGYVRIREQARLQLLGRHRGSPSYELLPVEAGRGLARLPEPSPGDLFLDLEGDPYVAGGGREFLVGWVVGDGGGAVAYRCEWAMTAAEERSAFERFVDEVMERWQREPGFHVYHFSPYEPGALKRLMGRHATREAEIDRMLRAGRFVDLYAVVRQSLRAGVESYSIKELEAFTGYQRVQELGEAGARLRAVQWALELDDLDLVTPEVRRGVEAYNRDDCVSALRLREWLESLRAELETHGTRVPRPVPQNGEASESIDERERRVQQWMDKLLEGVPAERAARNGEQHARWLLAHLLGWHRREDKAPWWEYFRLRELSDEELLEERAAIAGLTFDSIVGGTGRAPIHRYGYPRQETSLRKGDRLHAREIQSFGKVVGMDPVGRTIDIQKGGKAAGEHPSSIFAHEFFGTQVIAESLLRLGMWVADHGIDAPGPHRAARDLVLGRPPRVAGGRPLLLAGEGAVSAARRVGLSLEHGVLPIQGPPGAGKTFTGARMICDLVRAGRRVGVSAQSHKVIRHLLERVIEAAEKERLPIACIEKVKEDERGRGQHPVIQEAKDNGSVLSALRDGRAQVAGGTAWLWARPEFLESVDVMFVDEAGQMSLANVLALAQAGRSLVLLGDPQQLEQPQQGSHPEGTGVTALEHVLQGKLTIPSDRGLFLPETWRLHPSICAFTSELFYEGRLESRAGLERQGVVGCDGFTGAGLWFLPVEHRGNRSSCPEEVEVVVDLVGRFTTSGAQWIDDEGRDHPLSLEDILIVAPYNAQVADLAARLPGARVGTVDRFQGQEAPVVICSMTTSAPEDAPRGMEFLYSLNRLNVATSRAQCVCVLVASPRLFEPECQTPRQMRLANAFCRFAELARGHAGLRFSG